MSTPKPAPTENETHKAFMTRAMDDPAVCKAWPKIPARLAACQKAWQNRPAPSAAPSKPPTAAGDAADLTASAQRAGRQEISVPAVALQFREETIGPMFDLLAAADGDKGPPRFKMRLYSGAIMRNAWWGKVAVDLAGLKAARAKIPALQEHDPGRIIGWHDSIDISAAGVNSEGVFVADSQAGGEALAMARAGFPWQASMGVEPKVVEDVAEGATVEVNGHKLKGPGVVFRQSTLREGSLVVFGADPNTKAVAAAAAEDNITITCEFTNPTNPGDQTMAKSKTTPAATPAPTEPAAKPAADPADVTFTAEDVQLAGDVRFAEGQTAGRAEGLAAGATAERQRIAEIRKLALPGQDVLTASLIDDGATIEAAKDAYLAAARTERTAALADLAAAAPPSATSNGVTEHTDPAAAGQPASPDALRAEFEASDQKEGLLKLSDGDAEVAFAKFGLLKKAESDGRVRYSGHVSG